MPHVYTKERKTADSHPIRCFIFLLDLIGCKTVLLKIMKIGYGFYKW